MRAAWMAILLVVACAGRSQPEASASEGPDGSTALPADAGSPDASVAAGSPDASVSAQADAGFDAGTLAEADIPEASLLLPDGGAPAADCDGLMPASLPPVVAYVTNMSLASDYTCGLPAASGDGAVAYLTRSHPTWTFLGPSGEVTGRFAFWTGDLFAQPAGFIGYSGSSVSDMNAAAVLDPRGGVRWSTNVVGDSAWFAADPNGGLLAAGQLLPGNIEPVASTPQSAMMFALDGGIRWGPVPLGSSARIRGVGVDLAGRSLVLLDGSQLFGAGSVAGVWFDAAGAGPSEPFVVVASGGDESGFSLTPLQPDGLALQSLRTPFVFEETSLSEWLAVLPSGKTLTASVPAWLAQRPNTRISIARGGRAYAVLPMAGHLETCDQQLELVSLTGSSCGRMDLPLDKLACVSRPVTLGLDGTVMQMLPPAREPFDPLGSSVRDCTLRYWPAAFK
jgi:hypothetical protein